MSYDYEGLNKQGMITKGELGFILQEVAGSDSSALQAVVAADVELMALKAEEAEILARQEANGNATTNGDGNNDDSDHEDDESDRLNEIYDRMQASTSHDFQKVERLQFYSVGTHSVRVCTAFLSRTCMFSMSAKE